MTEKTILIVDDDNDLCQALAMRCQRLGMTAIVANDGPSAIQLAESFGPDIICLDVDMPGENGLAICEQLSRKLTSASAAIAILTGRKDIQTIDRCRVLDANYIYKDGNAWSELESFIKDQLIPNAFHSWIRLEQPKDNADLCSPSSKWSDPKHPRLESNKSHVVPNPMLASIFAMLGVDDHFLEKSTDGVDRLQSQRDFRASMAAPKGLTKPWVLHVDDDTDFSNALRMRLEAHDVSVVQACTGTSGIKQAFTNPVSAIVLDLGLPGGDGRYVLESLKACEATKHIPVVVLTGFRGDKLKQELLAIGADSFLEKPVPFETLFAKLSPHLGLPDASDKS